MPRLLIIKNAIRVGLFVSLMSGLGFINYNVRQTNAEYETLKLVNSVVNDEQKISELALLMAMASKESGFYDAAVGRDREVGLVQLQPEVAKAAGLRVASAPETPNLIERILFIEASEQDKNADERFDKEKTLTVAYGYLQRLSAQFKRKYKRNSKTALDFAIISYNLGIGNTERLITVGYSKDPWQFTDNLLTRGSEQGISRRKRIVTSDYFKRLKEMQRYYEQRMQAMLRQRNPNLGDYVNTGIGNVKRIIGRIY